MSEPNPDRHPGHCQPEGRVTSSPAQRRGIRRTRMARVCLPLLVLGIAAMGVLGPARVVEAARKWRSYPGTLHYQAEWDAGCPIVVSGTLNGNGAGTVLAKVGDIVTVGITGKSDCDELLRDHSMHPDALKTHWGAVGGNIEGGDEGDTVDVLVDTAGTVTVTGTTDDGQLDQFDDPPVTTVITIDVQPDRSWQAGDPISFSLSAAPNGGVVAPGQTITLGASAGDTDLLLPDNTLQGDGALQVYWSDGAKGTSRSWTAPDKPGTYTVSAYASDNGTNQYDDADAASQSVTLTVPEPVKDWSASPGLPAGGISASAVTVKPGAYVTLSAPDGQDYDSWTRGSDKGTTSSGGLRYSWTGGGLNSNSGRSVVWQAPAADDPGFVNGTLTRTFSCTGDDDLDAGDSGVTAPETGSRNDSPVSGSITITVDADSCGSWKHQSWDALPEVTWTVDGSGQETPAIANVVEHLKWNNACGGTAPDPDVQTESVPFTLLSDQIKRNGGGSPYREVKYQAKSTVLDGPPTGVVVGTYDLPSHWDPSPSIRGGEPAPLAADLAVEPEDTLSLGVGAAIDEDTYSQYGSKDQLIADEILYHWSIDGGGSFIGTDTLHSSGVIYKAPAATEFGEGETEKTIKVTCWIDDAWNKGNSGVYEPETGSRDDTQLDPQTFVFKVKLDDEGRWKHKDWVASTLSWRTNSDGDPEPLQPDQAQEILEWSGTQTKPDRIVGVPYRLKQDEAEQVEDIWMRKAKYVAYSTVGGPPTELAGQEVLPRHWDVPTDLEGGLLTAYVEGVSSPSGLATVGPGQAGILSVSLGGSLAFDIANAGDKDSYWYWHVPSQTTGDNIRYKWSVRQGNTDSPLGTDSSIVWSPTATGTYSISCELDDAWNDGQSGVGATELGQRNDKSLIYTVAVGVGQRVWLPAWSAYSGGLVVAQGKLGWDKKRVSNNLVWFETGRMISPQDQRLAPATPETIRVGTGAKVACAVEEAKDWDRHDSGTSLDPTSLLYDPRLDPDALDEVVYTWTADGGSFSSEGPDGEPLESTSASTREARWIAPTQPGTYTLTCTIDDQWSNEPVETGGAVPTGVVPPDAGTRNDTDLLVRTVTITVEDAPTVSFTGELTDDGKLRACAGGIDDSSMADLQERAHVRNITVAAKVNGQLTANLPLQFSFAGNKGHDYGITQPKLTARFYDSSNVDHWQETINVSTNDQGAVSLRVKSSDVVSRPVLEAWWTSPTGHKLLVGSLTCDFGAEVSFRRFPNPYDEQETIDTGWLFDSPRLSEENQLTPAKVYLKFHKQQDGGQDLPGYWNFVNGHVLRIRVVRVILMDGSEITGDPSALKDYAYAVDTPIPDEPANGVPYTDVVISGVNVNSNGLHDGAAWSAIKAGPKINQVASILVGADDLTPWAE